MSASRTESVGGQFLAVGGQQRRLVSAEAVDGQLAEGMAGDCHRVFVVGGGLVPAGAVKPGPGPGAGWERCERGDQLR